MQEPQQIFQISDILIPDDIENKKETKNKMNSEVK